MRRCGWALALGLAFLLPGHLLRAQSSLDALEEALKEAKQQRQDATTQVLTNFFTQVDAAMASPEAAIALYQQAGGTLPDPTPVVTEHENETETEREARQALDQANLTRLGAVLQLHCGMMHYAALFVVRPDQKGLQDDWAAWLKTAAATYPQLNLPAPPPEEKPDPQKKKKNRDGGAKATTRPPPFNPSDLKEKAMRDSIISKFLAFPWADKEQGGWSVQGLPELYRTNVLTPLRTSPTPATLAAWDTYIALANSDEHDDLKWNQVDFPPLQFDRACDDYAVTPSTEKLEVLVDLIKANPTAPQADDWIARVRGLLDDYRAHHGGAPAIAQNPAPSSPPAPTDPHVTVTTVQQGDATIITTHTNSAPVQNAPPAP